MLQEITQIITLLMGVLLGVAVPLLRYSLNNLSGRIDSRLEQLVEKIEAQGKRIAEIEQRQHEFELHITKEYVERKEFADYRNDVVREIKALEQQIKELSTDLLSQWKEFFGGANGKPRA